MRLVPNLRDWKATPISCRALRGFGEVAICQPMWKNFNIITSTWLLALDETLMSWTGTMITAESWDSHVMEDSHQQI